MSTTMLHSQNISKLLRQGLNPVAKSLSSGADPDSSIAVPGTNNNSTTAKTISPSSISLLSPIGQPLCSVFSDLSLHSDGTDESDISLNAVDTVKIYSMVAFSYFNPELPWEVLELDNGSYISLSRVVLEDGGVPLVLMMVCKDEFSKKVSKARLCQLSGILQDGLKGYKFE